MDLNHLALDGSVAGSQGDEVWGSQGGLPF